MKMKIFFFSYLNLFQASRIFFFILLYIAKWLGMLLQTVYPLPRERHKVRSQNKVPKF